MSFSAAHPLQSLRRPSKFLPSGRHTFVVEAPDAGRRLDAYLASRLPDVSRARLQDLIVLGHVHVSGRAHERLPRPADRLRAGERIEIDIPPLPRAGATLRAESTPLSIVYEDQDLMVIDKPAGMAVHPGAGRATGTLVQAVLAHYPDLPRLGGENRPGIVHRLDKDTSGLLVVAKSEAALRGLQEHIASRRVRREYLALVHGRLRRHSGTVDAPVGRDPRHRTRMAVVASGRPAVTHFRMLEAFQDATLLEVRLETGRTHQIRVHCVHLGHPIVGDPVYSRKANPWGLHRQALHAIRLAFVHPVSGIALGFTAPVPPDIESALEALRTSGRAVGQTTAGGRRRR